MISYSINVSKVDKKLLVDGKNGARYMSGVFIPNKDGTDQYGNDGFIVQSVSKEARAKGERGPIIGNWKELSAKPVEAKPAKNDDPVDRQPAIDNTPSNDDPF